MLLISHRGNTSGVNSIRENSQDYIDETISKGFDVEIDLWNVGSHLYLGHDLGQYKVSLDWLIVRKDSLWVHTKNISAAQFIMDSNLRFFFHEKERHTVIYNAGLIWSHDTNEACALSIIPLLDTRSFLRRGEFDAVYGICSDFVGI
jgi:hypothetical protein